MPMDSPPPLEPDYTDTLPPPISDLAGTDSSPIEDVMSSLKLSDSAIGKIEFIVIFAAFNNPQKRVSFHFTIYF